MFSLTVDQWTNVIVCNGKNFQVPQAPIFSTLHVPLSLFSLSLYYSLPCSSQKHSLLHYFWLMCIYTAADQTPHRLNLTMAEGEAGQHIASTGGKQEREKRLKQA